MPVAELPANDGAEVIDSPATKVCNGCSVKSTSVVTCPELTVIAARGSELNPVAEIDTLKRRLVD